MNDTTEVVKDLNIIDFDAKITIRCECGSRLTIGPNSVAGDCFRCGKTYMTWVQVEERH